MSVKTLRSHLPEYAKDIKINLGNVLTEEGAPDLNQAQINGIALASAYATKDRALIAAFEEDSQHTLSDEQIRAAKAAATIMAMNNIYYRFVHLSSHQDFSKMPANLRMNLIGNPGIEKIDFELYSLAVSALNGCGLCLDAHAETLMKAGVSSTGIQSAIRIAAVMNGVSQAMRLEQD